MEQQDAYLVRFAVDYRVGSWIGDHGFRIFVAIPIMIVLGTVSGGGSGSPATTTPGPRPSPPAGCCSSGRC